MSPSQSQVRVDEPKGQDSLFTSLPGGINIQSQQEQKPKLKRLPRRASSPRATKRKSREVSLQSEIEAAPSKDPSEKKGYLFAKRSFDIFFSLLVLVLFSWLYALVAIIIKCSEPGSPVLFTQTRITKDMKPFKIYKFRTMRVGAEAELAALEHLNEKDGPAFKIKGDPRITKCGRWLRKLSIDEMPQFLNVLLGHMSVVGPRPAIPKEVDSYSDYQRKRLAVKAGITCYWQTRLNRDDISFDEWINLDILYTRKCSIWTDLKLIAQTIGVVLTAQGR